MALAPDALTPQGGYPGDEDKARAAFATLDQSRTREDFLAAARWLEAPDDLQPLPRIRSASRVSICCVSSRASLGRRETP
jgi:hypothetical protein